ncbi:hypothetical protein M404DRAFT_1007997 [Pisolithus tinctorius Marx 270]|uniref:Uncharacterized protein n=1 Tax=Pisolithus tinctorius Marx 270 TaxID=870435 RepID=A0A0C3N1B7_PISTI|nr:hypothetical protein M404DRAFT_1007997 [Pisolithus tinctorius Marx 270]
MLYNVDPYLSTDSPSANANEVAIEDPGFVASLLPAPAQSDVSRVRTSAVQLGRHCC